MKQNVHLQSMYRHLSPFEKSASGNISKAYLTILMSNVCKRFYVKHDMKNEAGGWEGVRMCMCVCVGGGWGGWRWLFIIRCQHIFVCWKLAHI